MKKHQKISKQPVLFKYITGGYIPPIQENKPRHEIQKDFNKRGKTRR